MKIIYSIIDVVLGFIGSLGTLFIRTCQGGYDAGPIERPIKRRPKGGSSVN